MGGATEPDADAATAPAHRRGRPRAGLLREWLALSLGLLGLVSWLTVSGALHRLDLLAQDAAMRLRMLAPNPDIVLIAIDDASVEAIGRWPWRRALHAQAIAQISAQSPRALGLDILFGEPDADYPGDDALLARAIASAGNVVLPVAQRAIHASGGAADAPLPLLRQAAAQLGHVQVQVDPDGAVRHLFAREGPAGGPWPHLSVAMLCAAGTQQPACRGNAAPASGAWLREDLRGTVFTAGRPPFARYSYVDVLKGQLPAGALRGKYVLVGASAVGLGDMFAAPVASRGGRVAGVELLAHALNAELAGAHLRPAGPAVNVLFNLPPVVAALLSLVLLGPLAGLMGCAALALASVLLATLGAPLLGWELSAAPALAGIALAYPLWSWRRLSTAARFLQLQMQALQAQVPLAPQPDGPMVRYGDALERRIAAVEEASGRLQRLHHFVSESLRHLPSPTLVCDAAGRVLLANSAAAQHLALAEEALPGRHIGQLLGDLTEPQTGKALFEPHTAALGLQRPRQEARDALGRDLLVLCQVHGRKAAALGLITLVDLSAIRQAQRQRDQALNFISHDIRAPAASILTLLEMQREFPAQLAPAQLLARIERHAQAALSMAQGFVQLASAQADSYQRAPFDLVALLHEVVDGAWEAAQRCGVRVSLECPHVEALFEGDRNLILRAVGNVLGNALKFSPRGGAAHCTLQRHGDRWRIGVRDEGPGIAPELRARVFEPFMSGGAAGVQAGARRVGGVGLGLAFVDTVVRRHGGSIELDSEPAQGAHFMLLLPAARTADDRHA